jgi:hypothetical protein
MLVVAGLKIPNEGSLGQIRLKLICNFAVENRADVRVILVLGHLNFICPSIDTGYPSLTLGTIAFGA